MNDEIKKIAISQYLSYFKVWFVLVILAIVGVIVVAGKKLTSTSSVNTQANPERVFDYGDLLSAQEEDKLRELIAQKEEQLKIHIVLVTENKFIDYGEEYLARNIADDFYDQNNYGYDKVHGDGFLLYDFHVNEAGASYTYLSTCGSVERKFGDDEIDRVVYSVQTSDYAGYVAGIEAACAIMGRKGLIGSNTTFIVILIIALIIALIFAAAHKTHTLAPNTVSRGTYMKNEPKILHRQDQFLRKTVATQHIERSSGSSGGGGGHHVSSGGVSHGGGGGRH